MSQECCGAWPDMHRTPARRNPGVRDCAATGVPRAREGPRILNPSTPPPVGDHNTSPGVVFTLCPAMCSKRQLSFSDSVCCTSEHGRPGDLHCASRRPNIYCMAATGMSSDSQDGCARAKSRFSKIRPLARAPVKHTRPRASSRKTQKVSNARDTLLVSK